MLQFNYMFYGVKNTLLTILVALIFLLGGLVVLSHHQMSMTNNDTHTDCNTTCKIACFSQAIGNLIAIPNHPNTLAFVLPIITVAFSVTIIAVSFKILNQSFRYSLGPPLYKQLESYRI